LSVRTILLLGNPELYKLSDPVKEEELNSVKAIVKDLHDTLLDFRKRHGAGRAIAAPQIGIKKRLIYMFIDKPVVFINPVIENKSKETITVWDDCMCFPDLLVKVRRHKSCRISYKNLNWENKSLIIKDSLSELLQHEYDHLDGILAISKAIDEKSVILKSQKNFI
jgi:peptide deformylase